MSVFWGLIAIVTCVMLIIVWIIANAHSQKSVNVGVMLAISLFVILFSLGMYLKFGASALLSDYFVNQKKAEQAQKEIDSLGDLEQIIQKMEKIVHARQDAEGWLLLSRLYAKTERFHEAAQAFERFKQLSSQQPKEGLPSSPLPQIQLPVKVALANHLKDVVQDDEILFVYAQSAEGSTVPLAIVKRYAKDLPMVVILDDTMAMLPTATLRDVNRIRIVARISKTGEPIAQKGDLEGKSGIIDVAHPSDVVVVVIDSSI